MSTSFILSNHNRCYIFFLLFTPKQDRVQHTQYQIFAKRVKTTNYIVRFYLFLGLSKS